MSNASGNQSGDSAQTWDAVESGQSEDVEASLTGQGTSDRETVADLTEAQGDAVTPQEPVDEPPTQEELRAQRRAIGDDT